MAQTTKTTVRVGPQGRLVIPAAVRKALKVEPGTELAIRLEGEQLILERREAVERRLKARFAHIPQEVSLVEALLRERREEARREQGG
jgi:AbrB family looped-hinge helix DNA binding protein